MKCNVYVRKNFLLYDILLHMYMCLDIIESHNLYAYILFPTDASFGQLRSESQNVASRQHSLNSAYEQLVKQAEVCIAYEKSYHTWYCTIHCACR